VSVLNRPALRLTDSSAVGMGDGSRVGVGEIDIDRRELRGLESPVPVDSLYHVMHRMSGIVRPARSRRSTRSGRNDLGASNYSTMARGIVPRRPYQRSD
jgi:hypothetical protein